MTSLQAVRRVVGRMHAREQEVSNALAETATFVMQHLQVTFPPYPNPPPPKAAPPRLTLVEPHYTNWGVQSSAAAAATGLLPHM